MNTIDDLMYLAYKMRWCETDGSVQRAEGTLRTALESALKAEYERGRSDIIAGLRGPLQEYVYRTQAHAPFEHAEWVNQMGATLMRSLGHSEQNVKPEKHNAGY